MEPMKIIPASDKIYYNPKFLLNHVKTEAKAHNQQLYPDENFDSKIHINRRYLASLNAVNNSDKDPNSNIKNIRVGIHINPKFIHKHQPDEKLDTNRNGSSVVIGRDKPVSDSSSSYDFNYAGYEDRDISNSISKYKFIKTVISPPKTSTKQMCIKTKYSLKRVGSNRDTSAEIMSRNLQSKTGASPQLKSTKNQLASRISWSEFKKVSRTKLVRKSVLQSLVLARRRSSIISLRRTVMNPINRSPTKKRTLNICYFPKEAVRNGIAASSSSFKKLGKMKIIRKSLLKTQIEARNQVKKQLLGYRNSKNYTQINVGPKFVHKQGALMKWKTKKHPSDAVINKCRRNNVQMSKYLRKNNQPCPLYNRFGRCKGKDRGTCSKLHDPLYISICRKLLQGECSSKDCLLSHSMIPGKMPTCHHYLAGLCTRASCPFLHIKVNPKAPICTSFLQGYCPDVFNCMKRHEFICPIYAEKGVCPRGKSCTYPHRSPALVLTKLLKDDQKPLMVHCVEAAFDSSYSGDKKIDTEVSEPNESRQLLDCINGGPPSDHSERRARKNYVKETFTRYFAVTNSSGQEINDSVEHRSKSYRINSDEHVLQIR